MTAPNGVKEPLLIEPESAPDILGAIERLAVAKAQHEAEAARLGAVLEEIRARLAGPPPKATRRPRTRRKGGLPVVEATP